MQRNQTNNTQQFQEEKSDHKIGQGAYGAVYKTTFHGQLAAVKRIDNFFDQAHFTHRLIREIHILRLLKDHPNIIELKHINAPIDPNNFTKVELIFEYGQTSLDKMMYHGIKLEKIHIEFFMYQLLSALSYMHSAGIVHRDIKPANIIVNSSCELRLCDFGLARAIDTLPELVDGVQAELQKLPGMKPSSPYKSFRRNSLHVGTRWYRSPENILLSHYDYAMDLWSIGCVFAELLQMQSNAPYKKVKPLFPGKTCFPLTATNKNDLHSPTDQFNMITDIIGTPSTEDKGRVTNRNTDDFLAKLKDKPAKNLKLYFPCADDAALDLLSRFLVFDPSKRITAEHALNHPFFANMPNQAVKKFNFNEISASSDHQNFVNYYKLESLIEYQKLSEGILTDTDLGISQMDLKKLILAEIAAYQPKPIVVEESKPNNENATPNLSIDNTSQQTGNLQNNSLFTTGLNAKKRIAAATPQCDNKQMRSGWFSV